MPHPTFTFFSPHLILKNVRAGMVFYEKAFGAKELRKWNNSDGSVHVAEMEIDDALFHLHEEVLKNNQVSPESINTATILIGLFSEDPDVKFQQAISAGAKVITTLQDFDYGYRQGVVVDPFGHQWLLQKRI